MNFRIAFLALVFLFTSCAQTEYKYFVQTDNQLQKVNWEVNTLNYIPLADEYLNDSDVLSKTFQLIQLRNFSRLRHFFETQQSNAADFYLSKTLYFMAAAKYSNASIEIAKIEDNKFALIKKLIEIDLSYELSKQRGVNDYRRILEEYQQLLDKNPDNVILKNIIILRTRYIRYN